MALKYGSNLSKTTAKDEFVIVEPDDPYCKKKKIDLNETRVLETKVPDFNESFDGEDLRIKLIYVLKHEMSKAYISSYHLVH